MALPAEIANSYFATFTLGLVYGSTLCTSECLPYVASYIAGIGADFRKGVTTTFIYNSGRVAAYAILGALAGTLKLFINNTFITSYQKYALLAFGIISITVGIGIFFKGECFSNACSGKNCRSVELSKLAGRFETSAFIMGLSKGLVICPPLLALILSSLAFSAPIDSFFLALLFGLGTAISPLLILGGITGWLITKAPLLSRWTSRIGALILMLLGVSIIINAATMNTITM
ncbi:MAG: sulfite exporter TauE/SafE family protein [Candidatus Bathyarchaeales archaeon]